MLGKANAFSGFSVDDIGTARKFYGETLGLEVVDKEMGVIGLRLGSGAEVLVYPKGEAHTPATFTILNFEVPDIDKAVDALTANGVTFLQYDGFHQDDRGVMRGAERNEGPNIAWFTDPAGNVLAIIEE